MSDCKLAYTDDVTKKNYGSWDPWDPNNDCLVKGFSNILVSDNIYLRVEQPYFKDLNLPTFYTLSGCISILQNYFKYLLIDYKPFISGENLIKVMQVLLHSLNHVNINFIDKFNGWLVNKKYPVHTRLFRFLGICLQYINYPENFEAVVSTERDRIKTVFANDFEARLEKILEDK